MRNSSHAKAITSATDAAICRAMLRGGSRTFFAASLVLPSGVRKPATELYAFCRTADDAIDQGSDGNAALAQLQLRLQRIYERLPSDIAADRALANVVHRYAIPKIFPAALLEGFGWDAANRRYETLSQLTAYAVRVAGTVGAMVAMLMGVRDKELLSRACALGVAMQLTNIARDVGEDARNRRLYLPLQWLREANIDPQEWLAAPVFNAAIGGVIQRLLGAAESMYAHSDAGLARLPAACRPGMIAARLMYAEIGREVARRNFDSISQRAVVSWRRKASILADAALVAATSRAAAAAVCDFLPEANFLVESMPGAAVCVAARLPRLEQRVVWLVDLFERLERRETSGHSERKQQLHPA